MRVSGVRNVRGGGGYEQGRSLVYGVVIVAGTVENASFWNMADVKVGVARGSMNTG